MQTKLQWDPMVLEAVFRELYTREMTPKPDFIPQMFDVQGSTKDTESIEMIGGEGLLEDWSRSNNQVFYSDVDELWQKYFKHKKYSGGREIDRDFVDDLKLTAIRDRIRGLADATYKTRQMQGVEWFINGNLTTTAVDYKGRTYNAALPDGQSLFSAAHPYSPHNLTDTQSNLLTQELSIDSFDAAAIMMEEWVDDKGTLMAAKADTLIVPRNLARRAFQIAGITGKGEGYEPDSADHNVNMYEGKINVIINPFVTRRNAWVVADSSRMKRAMKWFDRRKPENGSITDFDTEVTKFKVVGRWSYGAVDWSWGVGSFPT
ncbi:phage head protein [Paenibacillus agaridevorans]|uniref:phage head protein n=1 Tax=Paenibacillus agaridevorans TaxID=171404 RepID=UPI001BE49732|nr:phage head protein [Paenibacillus agaridevorans]